MTEVSIHPVKHSDAQDIIEANMRSRDYHAPWAQPFTDMSGFDAWFGQLLTGPNAAFVARDGESRGIVGVFNLTEIVWGVFRSTYLGYYGMVDFARRGLMSEALRQVTHHAFDELGLHRIEANIQPENRASINLVRRIGFTKEGYSPSYLQIGGVWCDHERWALISSQRHKV
ncbi:GNAT family N-acetyltransferase [Agrobacterium rubi]|uniref:GNAT family N-acetyltransferase n=1 Tax=Agrobacterium rubi TaxID=28099 RepID=A0AAE7URD8_9HYPH|nr:GNAT family protein [Agrobacterium rubi]NTE85841.1 GNAT family N-acetyltransferase [Agrobacterium rubi]NTF01773.1 GNAT family N-acetyltransferase [Agrobacterium rubi]NTF36016.1 GNAT family N-acetyltransferase [Agrobacterium rubi]OCJ53182.1 phosphinothricin acetyltransferase [Agrobacterium rubi]QTG01106.1 GNAT family N-acetyltransferase [Agrobacterium rubi]